MKKAATLFVVLELADGFLTMWATSNGFIEVNPLMKSIAHTWVMPLQKIVVSLVGIGVILELVWRFPRLIALAKLSLTLASSFVTFILALNLIQLVGGA